MAEPSLGVFVVAPRAVAVAVEHESELAPALVALGLPVPSPVVVVVGGAGGLSEADLAQLQPLFDEAIVPVAAHRGATLVDGGTRSGVMAALGESRTRHAPDVPLVGVAALGTVRLSPGDDAPDAVDLDPHHSHFVLVPGRTWGDESPWLSLVARTIAAGAPSVTVLVNGGEIALQDVGHSVAAHRPVLVVDGSGRAADDLAGALDAGSGDRRTRRLTGTGLLGSVPANDPAQLARALDDALS